MKILKFELKKINGHIKNDYLHPIKKAIVKEDSFLNETKI